MASSSWPTARRCSVPVDLVLAPVDLQPAAHRVPVHPAREQADLVDPAPVNPVHVGLVRVARVPARRAQAVRVVPVAALAPVPREAARRWAMAASH